MDREERERREIRESSIVSKITVTNSVRMIDRCQSLMILGEFTQVIKSVFSP